MKLLCKFLLKALALLLAVCLIAIVIIWSQVPNLVADFLSKKMKTSVKIGHIGLSSDGFYIDQLAIYNPKKFTTPLAFSCEKITVNVPFSTLFTNHITAREIIFDQIFLGLEFTSLQSVNNNWNDIFDALQDNNASSSVEPSNQSLEIQSLILNEIQAKIYYQKEEKSKILKPISQITLNGLSTKEGNIISQLIQSSLGQAVKQIFIQENIKGFMDTIIQTPSKALSPFKKLFSLKTPEVTPPLELFSSDHPQEEETFSNKD